MSMYFCFWKVSGLDGAEHRLAASESAGPSTTRLETRNARKRKTGILESRRRCIAPPPYSARLPGYASSQRMQCPPDRSMTDHGVALAARQLPPGRNKSIEPTSPG